jgi:hypothetical protein
MTAAPIAIGRTLSVTETMEAGSFNDIHEALSISWFETRRSRRSSP